MSQEDMVYLDHAATTPVAPEVLQAMLPFYAETFMNPAGAYRPARQARAAVDEARATIGRVLGCSGDEIVFTSGGTESDNLALVGVARAMASAGRGRHLVTTAIEHEAVLNTVHHLEAEGFDATVVGVDGTGLVDATDVLDAVRGDTVLVSVMLANNVVGSVQPVSEIGKALRERQVLFHSDAVQAPLWLDLDVNGLGVDLLSLSAHKFLGPKGTGALYVRSGTPIEPLLYGGGQESGLRSGTSNVVGAVGLSTALELAAERRDDIVPRVGALRDRLVAELTAVPGVRLTGHPDLRMPNHASFTVEGVSADTVLLGLDRNGICAASSAACASGSHEPSSVLAAMGVPVDQSMGALRLTLGPATSDDQIDHVLQVLPGLLEALRSAGASGS